MNIIRNLPDDTELPAGEYYVGDPCYVLGEIWDEILHETDFFASLVFEVDGRACGVHSTQYGDGVYPFISGCGCEAGDCAVDSGTIACIPADLLPEGPYEDLGTAAYFRKPFRVRYEDGKIYFGDAYVNTGDDDDDEY